MANRRSQNAGARSAGLTDQTSTNPLITKKHATPTNPCMNPWLSTVHPTGPPSGGQDSDAASAMC
ncbi:hypothetical protein GCM10029964_080900 [Kibdelosporangium lantanae]